MTVTGTERACLLLMMLAIVLLSLLLLLLVCFHPAAIGMWAHSGTGPSA
jgi:hypothetical protein